MTTTQDNAPAIDLSTLSVADLAAMLAKARQAEKAKKAQESSLPQFAYVMVMTDSSLVYWSGRAESAAIAETLALAYAGRDGGEVFSDASGKLAICPRPIPAPRGRKAKIEAES
jgi:hypothetical protein